MKHLFSILIAFILLSSFTNCTNEDECEKIGAKKITVDYLVNNQTQFLDDFKTFMYCKFDTIDYVILKGPNNDAGFISMFAAGLVMNPKNMDKTITFNDFIEPIQAFKKSKEYAQTKEMILNLLQIYAIPATKKTWKEDSLLLRKINFADSNIAGIKKVVEENEHLNLNYANILSIYGMQVKERDSMEKERTKLTFISDYKEGMKKSKELSKPALVFFTGHGCVNSMEMEKKVINDLEIKKLINHNYVFVKLMVDEKQIKLPENEQVYSKSLNRKKTTLGDKNAEIQMDKYKTNMQPFFVIISSEGIEINTMNYTLNAEEFKRFLNSGLGK